MTSRIWILGASDPEMAAIEELLGKCGETVAYATVGGTRAHAGNAYMAEPQYPYDRIDGDLYLVECAFAIDCDARTVHTIDHHRPGDPGFGAPPEEFLRASSLGQVISELASFGALPDSWSDVSTANIEARYGTILQNVLGGWGAVQFGCEPESSSTIPDELVLTAAADHCLGAAYAGRCPGVDPDALMRWRVESRSKFQGRSVDEIMVDVARAKVALDDADDVGLWPIDSTGTCRGCGRRTSGDDWDYCECPKVADMRGTHVPELPEAGTRYGIAYVADGLPGPDGRRKVVCSGTAEVIRAFLDSFVTREGLVDPYGDPARGFAGAYHRVK